MWDTVGGNVQSAWRNQRGPSHLWKWTEFSTELDLTFQMEHADRKKRHTDRKYPHPVSRCRLHVRFSYLLQLAPSSSSDRKKQNNLLFPVVVFFYLQTPPVKLFLEWTKFPRKHLCSSLSLSLLFLWTGRRLLRTEPGCCCEHRVVERPPPP